MTSFEERKIAMPDGYECYARFWPVDQARGAILYLHGIQSHSGWFETSARVLADHGWAVLQVDRRGCGANPADRGHAESAEQLIGDAQAAGQELMRLAGMEAYHIVGVSWGGKLAVATYVTEPGAITGMTLVTPGLFPRDGVSKEVKAEIGFAMLYDRKISFDIPLNEGKLFTSIQQWRDFIDSDELTLRQCTAGFYLASRRMDKVVARLGTMEPIPIHLVLASDERIIDNDRTVEFIQGLDWPGVEAKTYPQARHSVEFEPCRDMFFRDMACRLAIAM
jgi:alpha-beta hydrolase superfamily lysophospholipase